METMPTSSISPTNSFWPTLKKSVLAALFLLAAGASCRAQSIHETKAQVEARFKRNAFRPGPKPPVPLEVEGDGRACMGYVHLKKNSFLWKWHWATCYADGWTVVERGPTSWTLKLKQTPAQVKACLGVRFVEVQPTYLDMDKSTWSFAGKDTLNEADKDLPIACSSMM